LKFLEIYNRIIAHWGDKIDFLDGAISEPEHKTPGTTPTGDGSFHSLSFSAQWDRIEEAVGYEDPYDDLMVWTMYQVFHTHALQLYLQKIYTLNPQEISMSEIEEQYYRNLQEEGWEEELATYER
jgi:hypothetical protein